MNASARLIAPNLPAELTNAEFAQFKRLAHDWAGINLEEQQRAMLYSRFCRRVRELNMPCFEAYADYARANERYERVFFVNKVTTNLTYFFREPHHFDHLVTHAIPALYNPDKPQKKIRIWSSACSSGQEPYSIAIALAEKKLDQIANLRVLSTDINSDMVELTRAGAFSMTDSRGLTDVLRYKWFTESADGFVAAPELRKLLLCSTLNLFGHWPFAGPVDVIFCRNALIYFSRELQGQLIRRFASVQQPGGFLYLGHSEVVPCTREYYERVDNTVFRRVP